MSTQCGSTTEEGNAVCIPAQCSCSSESKNDQLMQISLLPDKFSIKQFFLNLKKTISLSNKEKNYVEENS